MLLVKTHQKILLRNDTIGFTLFILDRELFEAGLSHLGEGLLTSLTRLHKLYLFELKILNLHVFAPVLTGNQSVSVGSCAGILIDVTSLIHPVRAQMLGHVVSNTIRQHHDDSLSLADLMFLDVLDGAPHSLSA